MANILISKRSDRKVPRFKGRGGRRDDQPVALPLPLPLSQKKRFNDDVQIVWPLGEPGRQPFFTGVINPLDKCVDMHDPAAVQCLYLMGHFGRGYRTRNQPNYKITATDPCQLTPCRGFSSQIIESDKTDSHKRQLQWQSLSNVPGYGDNLKHNLISELYQQTIDKDDILHQDIQAELHSNEAKEDESSDSDVEEPNTSEARPAILKLDLEEAFFLAYSLGVLTVVNQEKEKLTIDQIWQQFCHLHNEQDHEKFAVLYAAYHFYRARGWCVKNGGKFGCALILYKEGPPFYHSLFSLTIIKQRETDQEGTTIDNCEPKPEWTYITGFQRLSRAVLKQPVLCYVIIPQDINQEQFSSPTVIEKLFIKCVLIQRWRPGGESDRNCGVDADSD